MPQTLQALAEFTASRLIGDGKTEIAEVASIAHAQPGDLVFVESEGNLDDAMNCHASAVIVGEFAAEITTRKPLLISARPRLAFATAATLLYPARQHVPTVHASAVIDSSAKVAPTSGIGAHAVIEANAVIGERCYISAGCYIGEGVVIGDDCNIYPRVVIYPGTTIGRRVIVHAGAVLGSDGFGFVRDEKFPQVGRLVIGDYVEIGANCTIDRGALDETVIGPGTKLDNLVHVGHNCLVGANVVIAAQTGISGSSSVGDDCVLGGQVGIGDHAAIEPGAILAGQSGVLPNKTIRGKGVVFWGTPVKPVRQYLKELAVLSRLTRKSEK